MARSEDIDLPRGAITQLTNGDVTSIRVQNLGRHTIKLKATLTATPPTDFEGAIHLPPGEVWAHDLPLVDLWAAISTGRIYAYCEPNADGKVSVDHG